jgi:hypothetical protein
MRVHIFMILVVLTVSPCLASTPDGSTEAKAISLKQRIPAKAVEEEMQWMMKLYHYTPLLATRDELSKQAREAIRRAKAGQKQSTDRPPAPWGHATRDREGRLISYWWFRTPHGRRDIYFDTGTSINTPGEVARQETARAEYIGRMVPLLKLDI